MEYTKKELDELTKENKELKEKCRALEEKLKIITATSANTIALADKDGFYTYVSPSVKSILGYEPEELVGRHIMELVHPEDVPAVAEAYERALKNRAPGKAEYRYRRAGGDYVWFATTGDLILDEKGEVAGALFIGREITKRKASEETLKAAVQQLNYIIEYLPDATFAIDLDGRVIAWNKAMEEMTGLPKEEIMGRSGYAYAVPFYGEPRPLLIDLVLRNVVRREIDETYRGTYDYTNENGTSIVAEAFCPGLYGGLGAYLWGKASLLFGPDGSVIGAIESIRDTTERRQAEERLKYLSLHDPLTGLYNRAYFEEELQRMESSRCPQAGVIVCDVDDLKTVNDTLGHEAGDSLLKAAASVIKSCFREGDVVARIGGDEFAVLLPQMTKEGLEKSKKRIAAAVLKYNQSGCGLPLGISLGCAAREDASCSMKELVREADSNMYREKLKKGSKAKRNVAGWLLKALRAKDFFDTGHDKRMQEYTARLAAAAGMSGDKIINAQLLARFHDIGKAAVPDEIIHKPGPLSEGEWKIMKRHCEIGHRVALTLPGLAPIAGLILKHHEWWNGKGYPLGLAGEEIPVECRILAVADAFDAMTSKRPYRRALGVSEAVAELKRCAGTQFDPHLVHLFCKLL